MRALLRAALLVACTATVAQAQLGGLLKKAVEKKVSTKVEDKVAPGEEAPPLAGEPVSAAALDQLLKGLAVEVSSGQEYAAAHERLLKKQDEWRAADQAARPDEEAQAKARSKTESCMYPLLRKLEEQHQDAIQERMSHLGSDAKSQEFVKQYAALSQQMAAAQRKQDTAATTRVIRDMNKLMGLDAAADSAVARKTCGAPPAPTPAMVRAAALRKEADDLQEQARALEAGRAARAAAAAGMTVKEYATARERLYTWNVQKADKQKLSVTPDEDKLFSARKGEIKKVESVLR